jgi:hypothetical protein
MLDIVDRGAGETNALTEGLLRDPDRTTPNPDQTAYFSVDRVNCAQVAASSNLSVCQKLLNVNGANGQYSKRWIVSYDQ